MSARFPHIRFTRVGDVLLADEYIGRLVECHPWGRKQWEWQFNAKCPAHLRFDIGQRIRRGDLRREILDRHYVHPRKLLCDHWHTFCDADPIPDFDTFTETLEAVGLIALVPVTSDALSESFSAERGLEKGGMMWQLTKHGRVVFESEREAARAAAASRPTSQTSTSPAKRVERRAVNPSPARSASCNCPISTTHDHCGRGA